MQSRQITVERVINAATSHDSAVFAPARSLFSRFCPQIISFQDFTRMNQTIGRITPARSRIWEFDLDFFLIQIKPQKEGRLTTMRSKKIFSDKIHAPRPQRSLVRQDLGPPGAQGVSQAGKRYAEQKKSGVVES
jgi:hypothetical protein